jgi:peptide/nickel transport system substrate-binding protein
MESFTHTETTPTHNVAQDVVSPTQPALTRHRTHKYFGFFEELLKRFTPLERLALYGFTIGLGLSVALFLAAINESITTEIPARGGHIIEGETAPARFVNPVLAISQADLDITMLVYSGLVRAQEDGTFTPDLAEHYTISLDGTTYTFTIRSGATFHDGTPVTAADVAYTISLAQNPDIKSPRRADWEGVSISTPDERTIVFTLPHAYAPFMENATLGIMPKHIWESIPADQFPFSTYNTHPIGTGPFRIKNTATDDTGAATSFDLVSFNNFALGEPHLSRISFVFFRNDEEMLKAFEAGRIDSIAGISPTQLLALPKSVHLIQAPLPRVFGVFFNEAKNASLADGDVRSALAQAIDRQALVTNVLGGFGVPLTGPIPPGALGTITPSTAALFTPNGTSTAVGDPLLIAQAKKTLEKAGWEYDEANNAWSKKDTRLSIKIATADAPELIATAHTVADTWRTLGVDVSVHVYPLSEFNNTILRPREYEAILFGEVVGRDADVYAFWHSSQRNDPGLNLALYANSKADTLLSEARTATQRSKRDALLARFADIVETDAPAAFLYSPEFLYIIPSELKGVRIGALTTPAERFLEAHEWYTETQRVWEFFAR